MAVTQREINATPEQVFEVIMDPRNCAYWVVGAKQIRTVDDAWPDVGAAFHHTVGAGPLTLKDSTTLKDYQRPSRVVLRARARPAGIAEVILELQPVAEGCLATMEEYVVSGPARLVPRRLMDVTIDLRNKESLRRLAELAEQGGKREPAS